MMTQPASSNCPPSKKFPNPEAVSCTLWNNNKANKLHLNNLHTQKKNVWSLLVLASRKRKWIIQNSGTPKAATLGPRWKLLPEQGGRPLGSPGRQHRGLYVNTLTESTGFLRCKGYTQASSFLQDVLLGQHIHSL